LVEIENFLQKLFLCLFFGYRLARDRSTVRKSKKKCLAAKKNDFYFLKLKADRIPYAAGLNLEWGG
jgi:hypothetical protein